MDDFEHLDHYQLLDVSRSAGSDEIKRAYRRQIGRYHPDRFANASPEEQSYASRRALQINAAYRVLSDFNTRNAYNRSLGAAPAAPQTPPPPRDHQAELYEQAQAHLEAGRAMQAVATLRELQRINPFYRDSATLLAQAEAAARPSAPRRPESAGRRSPAAPPTASDARRRRLILGGLGGLILLGLGAMGWLARGAQTAVSTGAPAASTAVGTTATTAQPIAGAPVLTQTPAAGALNAVATPSIVRSPTIPPSPTAAPTASPTPQPAPAASPTPQPTAIPETGAVAYADRFDGEQSWPNIDNGTWRVGYADGAYEIRAQSGQGNIWAYRTSPIGADMLIAVDVAVSSGQAGLLLRFNETGRYLAFLVDPQAGTFRLEERTGQSLAVIIAAASPAIRPAAENRLAARLEGTALELRINGFPVADLELGTPEPGPRYGLVAVADTGEVVARFSNLALRALE